MTNTPVRSEIAEANELKAKKTGSATKEPPAKKALFDIAENTSSESEGEVELDDNSEAPSEDEECIERDFVVVKVCGKYRFKHFIARIDIVDGDDYEGVFLKRIASRTGIESSIFVPDPDDEAAFGKEDVVWKLLQPRSVGGLARTSCQLLFKTDLSQWNLS